MRSASDSTLMKPRPVLSSNRQTSLLLPTTQHYYQSMVLHYLVIYCYHNGRLSCVTDFLTLTFHKVVHWHASDVDSIRGFVIMRYINLLLTMTLTHTHTHTHTRLAALFSGLPRWAGTRKVKPIWILLKQETVSGSEICWAICKFAPRTRQINMPGPNHSSFLQVGCPSCCPTNSVKALKAQTITLTLEG